MSAEWNVDEAMKKPAFAALSQERKELLTELIGKLNGKNLMESVYIITAFMKKMPKGWELSRDEQDAMIAAFLETLPAAERKRYEGIINMMRSNTKKV